MHITLLQTFRIVKIVKKKIIVTGSILYFSLRSDDESNFLLSHQVLISSLKLITDTIYCITYYYLKFTITFTQKKMQLDYIFTDLNRTCVSYDALDGSVAAQTAAQPVCRNCSPVSSRYSSDRPTR